MAGSKRKIKDLAGKQEEDVDEKSEEGDVEMVDVEQLDDMTEKSKQGYQLDPMHLQVFYDRLFPFNEMFRWLAYGNDPDSKDDSVDKEYFHRREFTFIKEGDIYLRFKCFKNKTEFRNEIRKHRPLRMEIGPFYNAAPSLKASVSDFKPVEKELVFDIDMTDYDDVRTCCQDKQICRKCWVLMSCAIDVLDTALRDDFGFQHLLWVFSGRRGVHCWVADKRARHLKNDGRYAIGQYLNIYVGGESSVNKVDIGNKFPLHPSLERGYKKCLKYFERFAEEQGLFDTPESTQKLLEMLPNDKNQKSDRSFRKRLAESWLDEHLDKSPSWKIRQMIKTADNMKPKSKTSRTQNLVLYRKCQIAVRSLVMTYVYPRLDINVTRQINHLLKSPFVVHPGTGNVCVPIMIRDLETNEWIAHQFDPLSQPKLDVLHDELNENTSEDTNTTRLDIKKTSLQKYKKYFVTAFLDPLQKSIRESKVKQKGLEI